MMMSGLKGLKQVFYLYFQDDEEEFEAGSDKRDIQQEYKEVVDWLDDVERRASLMAQQWSEEGEEDETKKKRKAVRSWRIVYTKYNFV